MKKFFAIAGVCFSAVTFAQNTPVIEKSAPESNNALPSGGSLGSQSGVNPMGNPGTIANSAANNSGANSAIAPHPNTERGVFLTSSPEGTVTGTTVTTTTQNVEAARVVTSSGTVTAVVSEPATTVPANTTNARAVPPASSAPASATPTKTREVGKNIAATNNIEPVSKPQAVTAKTTTPAIPAYKPVLGNYVSEKTIEKINLKYGAAVYDIRTVRVAATNKIAYIVRLWDNDALRSELFYDE